MPATAKPLYLANELWLPPPPEKGSGRAFVLALAVHLLLFTFLYVGIRWNNQAPEAVEAELWSSIPQIEAPLPPEPVPVPDKPVEQKVESVPEPPKKVEPKAEKPDIALEQEKLRRKKEQEQKERLEKAKLEKQKEEDRKKEIARFNLPNKNPRVEGTATQNSTPSQEWEGLVASAIKANIKYPVPGDLKPGPKAVFEIRLLPSGEMMGAPRKVKSSGIVAYDEAVERAIRDTDPLPRPKNGIYPRTLELMFDPLEKKVK